MLTHWLIAYLDVLIISRDIAGVGVTRDIKSPKNQPSDDDKAVLVS